MLIWFRSAMKHYWARVAFNGVFLFAGTAAMRFLIPSLNSGSIAENLAGLAVGAACFGLVMGRLDRDALLTWKRSKSYRNTLIGSLLAAVILVTLYVLLKIGAAPHPRLW
jgi:hypothetical protein